jgi:hypothetical protein
MRDIIKDNKRILIPEWQARLRAMATLSTAAAYIGK